MKFCVPYLFSLFLLPFAVLGFFHSRFFALEDAATASYLRLSSLFMFAVSLVLAWHYAGLCSRRTTLNKLSDFTLHIANIDVRKISEKTLRQATRDAVSDLHYLEQQHFELLGFCVPTFITFISTFALSLSVSLKCALPYIFGCCILAILTKFACHLASICDVRAYKNSFDLFVKNITNAAKGIQYYSSLNFIKSKTISEEKSILNETRASFSKFTWRAFFYVAALFIVVVILFVAILEYSIADMTNIAGIEDMYITAMLLFALSSLSFFRCKSKGMFATADISKYEFRHEDVQNIKKINEDNLFIAFHGVYFQDPTQLSQTSVLNDLSLSVLPGEFIAITGENISGRSYVFDLLLKYYKPQSGQIYVSGAKVENISTGELRRLIGIFDEKFGLLSGTIYDNLRMTDYKIAEDRLLATAERVGLYDDELSQNVFDENGSLTISQEMLFRLQICRIAMRKPKAILIKTPSDFENEETRDMFYDFVNLSSKRKTVIITTDEPEVIIYADKVLYISDDEALFGSHASLSQNAKYQRYIKQIGKERMFPNRNENSR